MRWASAAFGVLFVGSLGARYYVGPVRKSDGGSTTKADGEADSPDEATDDAVARVTGKLAALERLKDSGQISDEEYREARQRVLTEA